MASNVHLDDVFLSVEAAADRVGVPESTIRRWCAGGLRHLDTVDNRKASGPKGTVILLSNLLRFVEDKSVSIALGKPATATTSKGRPGRPRRGAAPTPGEDFMDDLMPKKGGRP